MVDIREQYFATQYIFHVTAYNAVTWNVAFDGSTKPLSYTMPC